MKTLLNIIWLVLCGFWLFLGYALAGVICCILIITIPLGIASFRMANYVLWPFGRTDRAEAARGRLLVSRQRDLVHFRRSVARDRAHRLGRRPAITIIGIPLAIADFKMIPISLAPLGKDIVPTGGTTIVPPQTAVARV